MFRAGVHANFDKPVVCFTMALMAGLVEIVFINGRFGIVLLVNIMNDRGSMTTDAVGGLLGPQCNGLTVQRSVIGRHRR